jgi:hypothetical protein
MVKTAVIAIGCNSDQPMPSTERRYRNRRSSRTSANRKWRAVQTADR